LVLVWCLECYHYHMSEIVGWFQLSSYVSPSYCIWHNWWWVGNFGWAYGIKYIGCVAPFLWFLKTITIASVHNILALMLNPRFKWLKCIIDFFGHEKVKLVVVKYDMKCSHFLNLHDVKFGPSVVECPFDSLFYTQLLGAKANRCTSWLTTLQNLGCWWTFYF
jgi:hypothetical protein